MKSRKVLCWLAFDGCRIKGSADPYVYYGCENGHLNRYQQEAREGSPTERAASSLACCYRPIVFKVYFSSFLLEAVPLHGISVKFIVHNAVDFERL